ncbi:MAG: hypothetical protein KAJ75_05825, partial [Alphaproteobacteria bacterium]|nr:hypothetical protein [Alphaproteobacteria bacterium]
IGGKYGTKGPDGLSYTEKEYDYAVEKGINVIALIHGNPEEISVGKSEKTYEGKEALDSFKERVSKCRVVKFWNKPEELSGLVALNINKAIKRYPAVGWVRGNTTASEEILSEINELRKEKDALKVKLAEFESKPDIENLADLDEEITIQGRFYSSYCMEDDPFWKKTISWKNVFALISPYLMQYSNHNEVSEKLASALASKDECTSTLNDQTFQTILLQFKMLGLINVEHSETTNGQMTLFWSLTPKGEQLMLQERAVKTKK